MVLPYRRDEDGENQGNEDEELNAHRPILAGMLDQ
jgi:hypothetical protein